MFADRWATFKAKGNSGVQMRIFLAGATGAIGRPLVPLLIADGHEVTGTTRSAEKAKVRLKSENVVTGSPRNSCQISPRSHSEAWRSSPGGGATPRSAPSLERGVGSD